MPPPLLGKYFWIVSVGTSEALKFWPNSHSKLWRLLYDHVSAVARTWLRLKNACAQFCVRLCAYASARVCSMRVCLHLFTRLCFRLCMLVSPLYVLMWMRWRNSLYAHRNACVQICVRSWGCVCVKLGMNVHARNSLYVYTNAGVR